jgi:hypothetical protein
MQLNGFLNEKQNTMKRSKGLKNEIILELKSVEALKDGLKSFVL